DLLIRLVETLPLVQEENELPHGPWAALAQLDRLAITGDGLVGVAAEVFEVCFRQQDGGPPRPANRDRVQVRSCQFETAPIALTGLLDQPKRFAVPPEGSLAALDLLDLAKEALETCPVLGLQGEVEAEQPEPQVILVARQGGQPSPDLRRPLWVV